MAENTLHLASKKRRLLSLYIDFLLFMTLWGILSYYLAPDRNMPFWLPYIAFVVARTLLTKFYGSIGDSFLSIDRDSFCVDDDIYRRENWLSILLGLLFILEGTKQLVRWTQMFVAQPSFGFFPDETTQIMIHVVSGSFFILAGYWFLKLDIRGFIVGIGVTITHLISDGLSWNLWDPVVEQMVLTRREVQGLAIRDGEIEMMQLLMPEGMIAVATVILIAMVICLPRFKKIG
jgi:hypothetical protein